MYNNFRIRQVRKSGTEEQSYSNVGQAVSLSLFNIVCVEFPFKFTPELKSVPSRDWPDENGEDIYMPSEGSVKLAPYDLEVKFLYKRDLSNDSSKVNHMRSDIMGFIRFITGDANITGYDSNRNPIWSYGDEDKSSMLAISDDYTGLGFKGIYVKSISNTLYAYNDININGIAEFTVTFRVSDVTYSNW